MKSSIPALSLITIPASALVDAGGQAYVMVNDNGTARRCNVTVNSTGSGLAVITDGLRSGQRVILNPGAVKEGQVVTEE